MKKDTCTVLGGIVFYVAEFIGVASILIIMCSVDGITLESLPVVFIISLIGALSLVTAVVLDDPNRVLRHVAAIYTCILAFIGCHFKTRNINIIVARKKKKKFGNSYARLYRYCLKYWDILTYNLPTSRYFHGFEGPAYDRYYLKDEYRRIQNLRKSRIKRFNYDVRGAYYYASK